MIRNDISTLLPENPPLSLEEYVMQLAQERAASSVYRARDFQRSDPNFDGSLAAPVVGQAAMDPFGPQDPLDDPRQRQQLQQQAPAWQGALDTMAGAQW